MKLAMFSNVLLAVVLISCEDFKDVRIKTKNNIDSVEVVTTSEDTVIIFSGNYVTIVPKHYH
jgi:hypothetical protein